MGNIRKPLATHRARGLTLVEMLMATALTLIMFAAVAQIFGMMGGAMQDARATIELSGNLRSVTNHLQRDLDNLTVEVKPWVQPGSNQGYFEIIEGPDRDVDFAAVDVIDNTEYPASGQNGSVAGDADDILCFTAYSKDEPFVGLIQGELRVNEGGYTNDIPHKYWIDRTTNPGIFTTVTSQYAEIVYFTKLTQADDRNLYAGLDNLNQRDANETVTVYRRVFLIRPDIFVGNPNTHDWDLNNWANGKSFTLDETEARNYFDLSLSRFENASGVPRNNGWRTNSLEDLQIRKNRFAHQSSALNVFPHPIQPGAILSFEQLDQQISGVGTNLRDRTGEDVILTRALAFDVKVFDPIVSVGHDSDGTITLQPGDLGYATVDMANPMMGAFMDLHWNAENRFNTPSNASIFRSGPHIKSQLHNHTYSSTLEQSPTMGAPATSSPSGTLLYAYYDTWPFYYEIGGPGTNGFDDGGIPGVVDDIEEYQTSPPYPVPLRGISITVRAIEDGTRQVRQDTIMADFLPK